MAADILISMLNPIDPHRTDIKQRLPNYRKPGLMKGYSNIVNVKPIRTLC